MKYIWVVLLLVLVNSCKTDTTQETSGSKSNNESVIVPYEDPYQIYIIDIDRLRLRDAPGSHSKILANLEEHDIVYSRGEISSIIDTIDIRNQQKIAPYYKVTSILGEGWLYGGAITKIHEGSDDIKAPNSIKKLNKDLRSIEKKNISVGGWMANRITEEDMSNPKINDMYLAIAMDALNDAEFLYSVSMEKQMEAAGFTDDDYRSIFDRTFDPTSNPFSKKAYDGGFVMDVGEGMYWPVLGLTRFMEIIGGPFSESMKAYAEVDKFIYENPYMTDAGIFTKKEVIAGVIDKVTTYQNQYPNNLHKKRNKEMIGWMINNIKYGSDYTPAFDYETGEMYPEWKTELLSIIKSRQGSSWIKELELFQGEMKEKGWKLPTTEY